MNVVWVLKIDHRHGSNVTVHSTESAAQAALLTYVQEWWCETDGRCGAPDTVPADADEAIDTYFEVMGDTEWYSIDESTIS